jgi:hypothetical protein
MGDNLIDYIEKLEYLIFFSGYPLVYSLVYFMYSRGKQHQQTLSKRLVALLPIAYALTATIFFGFWIREMVIRANIQNIQPETIAFLKAWGLLAILFWIPLFNRKPYYSLLHSLVFFFIFFKDLVTGINSADGRDIIRNEMKIYTISLVLNLFSLIMVLLVSFLLKKRFSQH